MELLFFNKKDTDNEVLKINLKNKMIEIDYTTPQLVGKNIKELTIREKIII